MAILTHSPYMDTLRKSEFLFELKIITVFSFNIQSIITTPPLLELCSKASGEIFERSLAHISLKLIS